MPDKRSLLWPRRVLPQLLLALLPVLVHLPALSGLFRFDPIYVVSGLTAGAWHPNGLLGGYPGWADGNAGVTTQALGALAAQSWLHGHVPWWNPYAGVGMPLAAEGQTPAMFLPFVLLLAVPHGLLLLRMVLMAVAGLAGFALLRRMSMGVTAAFTGAALFELNGCFAWLAHGPMLPVAFLPLILLGLEQARGGAFPIAATLGVAWTFLAGFPETAALNLLFAFLWGCVRLAQAERRAAYAARSVMAVAAGLLLAAPAIWPFLQALPMEFLGRHETAESAGLLPGSGALLLFPYIYGNIMQTALALGDAGGVWTRVGGYCDIVLVALALVALRRRAPDAVLRWALLGWLLVTAGRATGLAPFVAIFAAVPLLRQAAVHDYILPSWSLALCVLAAYAVQDWRDGARLRLAIAACVAAILAAAALVIALPELRLIHAVTGVPATIAAILLPVVILSCVYAQLSHAPTQTRAMAVSACAVFYAACLAGLPLLAGTHGRALDTGAIAWLQKNAGLGRIVSFGPMVPNYGSMFGIAEIDTNALPAPRLWVDYLRAHVQPSSDGINFYDGGTPDSATLAHALPAYQELGVSHAVTWAGEHLAARLPGAYPVYHGTIMDIWSLPAPAPYAAAPGCTIAGSREAMTADCARASVLLRRELDFPGWQARVNGNDAAITRQDIFQAVALPAGRSNITFSYAPPGIVWAWMLACIGATLSAGSKAFFFEKKKQKTFTNR